MRDIDTDDFLFTPEAIFNRYYGRLCYFAYQLIRDPSVAEDLAQDAFVAYWSNREKIADHPNAIKDYLYSSVRNACLNIIRRRKVVERYQNSQSEDDFKEEKIIHSLIESEVIERLHQAIDTLPEGCRKVFRLGYLEGFSNSKVAEILNISINTVRNQKQRGLKALREKLDFETFLFVLLMLYHS